MERNNNLDGILQAFYICYSLNWFTDSLHSIHYNCGSLCTLVSPATSLFLRMLEILTLFLLGGKKPSRENFAPEMLLFVRSKFM